jgi:carbon-monoxide dehydrogenase large subunit
MICEGQIQGGIAQGIGQALFEHVVYEGDSGQLLTGTFMDYAMPRADDMPRYRLKLAEIPCKTNPLGVKGVGEAGTIGAPPAIINALLDALRPFGVTHIDMPATPSRVWTAINAARVRVEARQAEVQGT